MQLGTRWAAAATIPSSVPTLLRSEIGKIEAELSQQGVPLADRAWTLTWLENRPICRLDSGPELTITSGGLVVRHDAEEELNKTADDDDWLEN